MKGMVIHRGVYIQFLSPVINRPQWQLFTGLNPQKIDQMAFSGRKKNRHRKIGDDQEADRGI
jgi:hypothetical protein